MNKARFWINNVEIHPIEFTIEEILSDRTRLFYIKYNELFEPTENLKTIVNCSNSLFFKYELDGNSFEISTYIQDYNIHQVFDATVIELWLREMTPGYKLTVDYPRICFKCERKLGFGDLYIENYKNSTREYLEMVWKCKYVQLYCCTCFKEEMWELAEVSLERG